MIAPAEPTEPAARSATASADARPVVLLTAASEASGRRALRHGHHLFGPDHRYVVAAVHRPGEDRPDVDALVSAIADGSPAPVEGLVVHGDPTRAICDAAREWAATVVVAGVDVTADDRVPPDALRLLRRCPCPVVFVAV